MSSEFEPLRVGLIGCGGMGVRHARAVAEMHGRGCRPVEIVAICDMDPARRAPIAALIRQSCGEAPAEYATLSALLDDQRIEAVDIVLPTSLHHTAIIAAMEAGKHVLVEKPLALTVAACDLIVDAAVRANKIVAVAENYRRIASNRAIGGLIRAGAFGSLDAMFVRNLASPEPPVKPGEKPIESPLWYRDRTRAGGYHVMEMGVHEADLQHFWFGPVQTVQAKTHLFVRDRNAQLNPSEDMLIATFEFADGFVSTLSFSSTIRGFEAADRLLIGRDAVVASGAWHAWQGGEALFEREGRKATDDLVSDWLKDLSEEERNRLLPPGAWIEGRASVATEPLTYGVGLAIHDFARAARTGTQPEINAELARRAVATCCAMLESAELGTAVNVDRVLSGEICAAQAALNHAIGLEA